MSEKESKKNSGIEITLNKFGYYIFIGSIFSLIVFIIIATQSKDSSLTMVYVFTGIGILAIGLIFSILFSAVAEIIRLLKRQNNLPYSGVISGTDDDSTHR